jgi:hypothetical protein
MPLLSDIYNTIDSLKRQGSNFIKNPKSELNEMLSLTNDRARAFNKLQKEATAEGMEYGPKTQEMAQQMAEGYAPGGITVWHGSPHKFARFDIAKMGTGEGQQVIAPGLYMAENKDFAKGFTKDQRGQAAPTIAEKYVNNWGDPNLAIQKLDERYKAVLNESNSSFAQPYKDAADMLRKGETDFGGSLYKVDLPDKHILKMLDYNSELKNQPANVRKLAKQHGVDLSDTGFDLLQKIGRDQAGADKLRQAGIPGIKYANEMTPGTNNYVVFDPNHLSILERNEQLIK